MFVDIALQFILATIIGSIWAAPFVITPAARRTLDKEALKFFLRSFFYCVSLWLSLETWIFSTRMLLTRTRIPLYSGIRIRRQK